MIFRRETVFSGVTVAVSFEMEQDGKVVMQMPVTTENLVIAPLTMTLGGSGKNMIDDLASVWIHQITDDIRNGIILEIESCQ